VYVVRPFAAHAPPDGSRLVVAPEALSRFYLGSGDGGSHAAARVGATWMTREDRVAEVSDYVAYLDAVHDRVFEGVARADVLVTVLGFSQGVATASRWVEHGRVRADRLVAWAGLLPHDAGLTAPESPLRRTRLTMVRGTEDTLADPRLVEAERERLREQGIECHEITFEGGHRMDGATLLAVAALA
jgi:predicted esterase